MLTNDEKRYFKNKLIEEKNRIEDIIGLMNKNETIGEDAQNFSELSLYDNHTGDIGSEVTETSNTDTGIDADGTHAVSVKACSSDSTYTESEAGTANLQYVTKTINVALYYLNGQQYLYNTSVSVKVGLTYSWEDLDRLAGSYAASQGWTVNSGSEHVYSSTNTINIQVTPTNAPVEGQQ